MPERRLFSLSSPDGGQDHLTLDAIVAYVDDELTAGPHARAEAHLSRCAECRAEVVEQRQARAALQTAAGPRLPSGLLQSLRCIPVETELPPPPPGLAVTADGQFVLLRDVPEAAAEPAPSVPAPRRFSRRARIGAVSGLAVGALAAGAFVAPTPPAPAPPGVLGGAVLNVPVQARLSAVPAVARTVAAQTPADLLDDATGPTESAEPTAVVDDEVRARLDRAPVVFYRGR
jgi:anti-sigma factor RsiW